MRAGTALLMFVVLIMFAVTKSAFVDYTRQYVEVFTEESTDVDRQQLLRNVNVLRNVVVNDKLELMQELAALETLLTRTVVIETSDFLLPEDSVAATSPTAVSTDPAVDCQDVRKQDVPMSNEQMTMLYEAYLLHMSNIKQFKSNIFLAIAAVRAKVNMLEPDLSVGQLDPETVADGITATDASLAKSASRFEQVRDLEASLENIRSMLDSFYDDFRKLTKVARHMRCVNRRVLSLVHGDAKTENLVMYKVVMSTI